MSVAVQLSMLRRASGLSARALGAIAGVPASTVTRVESGVMCPSVELLGRLFAPLGRRIALEPVADFSAVVAARTGQGEFSARWEAAKLNREERFAQAGRAAQPRYRPGARVLTGVTIRVLPKGAVLSGSPAANIYVESAPDATAIVYLAEPWSIEFEAGESTVVLLPFDGVSESGAREIDGQLVAAPEQVAIDCFGLDGRVPEQAEALLRAMRGQTL